MERPIPWANLLQPGSNLRDDHLNAPLPGDWSARAIRSQVAGRQ